MKQTYNMSERRAWFYLAKLWDKPRDMYSYHIITHIKVSKISSISYGLCSAISQMYKHNMISGEILNIMKNQIWVKLKPCGYKWNITLEGAKKRAAFCRKMAWECTARNKKRRGN